MSRAVRRHTLFPLGAFMDALKTSNIQEHLFLVSHLHPFLRIPVSCCLNLYSVMHLFVLYHSCFWVCLSHYTVISFRLELGLPCFCTFSLNPGVWKTVGASQICVEWDKIWQCLRCCASCPSGLECFDFLNVQSSVLGTGMTYFVSIQRGIALMCESCINEPGIRL